MKNLISIFVGVLFMVSNLFGQVIKICDDFHFIPSIDSTNGFVKYMTNTVVSQKTEKGKLIELEGELVKSYITIDTSFSTLEVIEAGNKRNFKLEVDSINVYDISYTENDTLFQLIDKDCHFSLNNGYKLHLRFTNNKLSFIKIKENNYIVDYSFVKPEDVERFFDILQYNKEVIMNNK